MFGPDGMCLDADGAVWAADALANRVVRVAEGGEILDEIPAGEGCYACMLGGDDGRTLFMCVAPGFDEHERTATREGRILSTDGRHPPRRHPLTTRSGPDRRSHVRPRSGPRTGSGGVRSRGGGGCR